MSMIAAQQRSGEDPSEYAALTGAAGMVMLDDRTQIELTGRDCAAFLHNLCTNDIKRLASGSGCEAFLCNVQGKIVGHVLVFRGGESLVLETVPGQAERLIAHLDRYLIREQVELLDRSTDWAEILLAGPAAGDVLARTGIEARTDRLAHVAGEIAGEPVAVRRVEMTRAGGYLISFSRETVESIWESLQRAGAAACAGETLETARIEAGWPWYGRDITDENLPQELNRDKLAISFTKGCYLGQETVARIDALGHVNRTLCGVRFSDEAPPAGAELFAAGKSIGKVTSVCYSRALHAPLALAYMRRGHTAPGAAIEAPPGAVVALPV
jgi:tRNA-modifying protein YgfZ